MRVVMLCFSLLALTLLACVTETEPAAPAAPESAEDGRRALGRNDPRPLPRLTGMTLEGQAVDFEVLRGRRIVLFVFDPDAEEAAVAVRAVAAMADERTRHNFEIAGVATGANPERARAFAAAEGLRFPILDDSGGAIARRLRIQAPVTVLATDAEGYVIYAVRRFPGAGDVASTRLEARLREKLRIPPAARGDGLLSRPAAPDFHAERLDGGDAVSLASLRGRGFLLVFFIHDCPYCQAALLTLKQQLAALPEASRPELFGVEVSGQTGSIAESLVAADLDFFPVLRDGDWSLREAYGVFGEVPVIFFVDAEARILYRTKPGWDGNRDPEIVGAWLRKLAGAPIPLPTNAHGYSGSDVCGACHESEYATWQLTAHASAFDTLVTHGAERDAECVGCHVVGFGTAGGYALTQQRGHPPADLEDVGCESCHGRGGPHASPDFLSDENYEPVCVTCHDTKHSLFDYASFNARVSHATLATLSAEELAELQASRGRAHSALPMSAAFVGSDACAQCHPAESAIWEGSAHARSVASLAAPAQLGNPDCLRCHTTGFGRSGGFPEDGRVEAHGDLARVGCESCHGPGGDHVAEGAERRGSIVALTDKCDTCVILQICGACHDDANDPGFRFEVQRKIDLQRHGSQPRAASPTRERTRQGRPEANSAQPKPPTG